MKSDNELEQEKWGSKDKQQSELLHKQMAQFDPV